MHHMKFGYFWTSAALVGLVTVAGVGAAAAQPGAPEKHPDFSGIWMTDKAYNQMPLPSSAMTPEGERILARNKKGIAESDPNIDTSLACMPTGLPRSTLANSPFVIIQTPKVLAMVGEPTSGRMRSICIGLEHIPGLTPQFHGDSVAHWEGDTLVVDVVNVDDRTFYNMPGIPHSKAFHAVEHFRFVNGGKLLEDKVDIDDPIIFTKPWSMTLDYARRTDVRPVEHVCSNQRLRP